MPEELSPHPQPENTSGSNDGINDFEEFLVELGRNQKGNSIPWEVTSGQIVDRVRELLAEAGKDKLTELMRRGAFEKKATEIITEAQRNPRNLVILYGDLNGLHEINNNYDHILGDHLIMGVGQAIRGRKRESDIVSRWGGDEFVVLCNYVKPEAVMALISGFQEAIDSRLTEIARMFNLPEEDVQKIGISLGSTTITKEEIAELPIDLSPSQKVEFLKKYLLQAEKGMMVNKKLKKANRTSS